MFSRAQTKIDQKEYLKKYLSGDKEKKKKKKDKKQKRSEKVKIIDDDINHLDSGLQIDEELLLTGDDAPQIVGEYIQEIASDSKIPKWKSFGVKEEPIDETMSDKCNEEDLWGRKNVDKNISNKLSRRQLPDNSPRRRKDRNRQSPSCSPPSRQLPDNSPPRRNDKNRHSPSRSPSRRQLPDNSPRRRKDRNRKSPSYSPPRRQLPDNSPPRRKDRNKRSPEHSSTNRSESSKHPDLSPSRRRDSRSPPSRSPQRQDKHSELRRKNSPRRRNDSDQSPIRKGNIVSDKGRKQFSDQSPLRSGRDNVKSFRERSPLRKEKRQSTDQSPPRRREVSTRERKISPDQSPARRRRDSDQSPPRKNINSPSRDRKRSPNNNNNRKSPTRGGRSSPLSRIKREKTSSDLSPPRHSKIKRESLSPPAPPARKQSRWERQEQEKSLSPPPTHKQKATKTLEGKKAGLQDAHDLHKESLERRKQEDVLFSKMSSDISGRNAEIQVRSTGRQGRRARAAKEEDPEERRRKEAHEEKKKQLYDRWGKGLKQIEDYKNRLAEHEHESNKPLARYSNDEDLERHLKEQERADDPMLEYMRQKRKDKEILSGKPQVPIYQGSFPENRFGIRPGYRWDGVDRSNGYEKKYFDVQNEKRARQDEAYKYSVEDM